MKNNEIGKIAVANAGHPRSRFNLAHDVNTTASFGDLQPLQCQFMVPDSKATLNIEHLIRAAPMPSPTFGRIDYKVWNMFVPLDEVFPNYDAMMSRSRVSRSGSSGVVEFVPQQLPTITPKKLACALLLPGCTSSIWISEHLSEMPEYTNLGEVNFWRQYTTEHSSTLTENLKNLIIEPNWLSSQDLPDFDYHGAAFNLGWLFSENFGGEGEVPNFLIPSGSSPLDYKNLDLESADFVIMHNIIPAGTLDSHARGLAIAIKLSSYGQRMFKLLNGLGYPISFEDDKTELSLLPLLAWYRGYFELFGLELYSNFEESACSGLIQYIMNDNVRGFVGNGSGNPYFSTNSVLWDFFRDLGDCYVTEDVDYVSQHLATAGTAAYSGTGSEMLAQTLAFANSNKFIDTSIMTNLFQANFGSLNTAAGLSYNGVSHGALDEQLMKIFFRWTNRQTIMGSDIEKNLRALGLGHYVDEVKVDFLGYFTKSLNISDITATADTHQDLSSGGSSGSFLGEFAGKSVTYDKTQVISWETKKAGYWLTYAAIVPKSGYCQAYDSTITAVHPFDIYTPELDSRGYEATTKKELFGYGQISSRSDDIGDFDTVFGMRPRYLNFKVTRNIANGDFSLHSRRATYLPFMLDKLLPINERVQRTISEDGYHRIVAWFRQLDFASTPVAGNIWRFAYRYGFLGNLNRMFVNSDDDASLAIESGESLLDNSAWVYTNNFTDNFIVHNILNFQYYAPMLPTGASYQTSDDEAKANAAVDKA